MKVTVNKKTWASNYSTGWGSLELIFPSFLVSEERAPNSVPIPVQQLEGGGPPCRTQRTNRYDSGAQTKASHEGFRRRREQAPQERVSPRPLQVGGTWYHMVWTASSYLTSWFPLPVRCSLSWCVKCTTTAKAGYGVSRFSVMSDRIPAIEIE